MADRTRDRAEAVVQLPAAEATGEITAPLSAAEIAAELAGSVAPAAEPEPAAETDPKAAPEPEPKAASEPDPEPAAEASGAADAADAAGEADGPAEQVPVPERHSGDRIADRYRLEECISRTTQFSSWRAVDETLRRAVGVHLLAAGNPRADGVLAAARSAALLGDPRFVQVLDAVREGDLVYVIREWLPAATDLATLLSDGPLEPYEAYQMVRQVTDAVAAAHASGRSHLRLTPRCVLRTDTGQYRINGVAVDAALRGAADPADATGPAAELADTRAIGTLLYAALTHRWPHPQDRYDLRGLPADAGLLPPDQVRSGVHQGLSDLAARTLCEPPPGELAPITSPAELAKEIALLPRIRPPQAESGAATDRYPAPGQTVQRDRVARPGPASRHTPPPPGTRPARPQPPRPARRRSRRQLAKRTAQWTVSVVLLAAIGYGSWQLAGKLGESGPPTALGTSGAGLPPSSSASAKPTPLTIANLTSFNPFGDHPMHPDLLGAAHDNDPSTAWQTDGYFDDLPTIGHGTGLLVDLGAARPVSSVSVQFLGATSAELRVPTGAGDGTPTKFEEFGQPVAHGNGTDVQLQPGSPVTSRYLLIWLTGLPKDGTGRYRGQVAEIKVTG
ncbi:serine/threonine protein kinase [Streptomyces tateyamensis]|uniref:Serine/threonine protein kinase n=1 Tax=Streptomyces tateyamensis TaxID=565073 RepID=A0A2V4P1Y3_9ACTN|nr:protein kinase family protein [Streptomyces tateyamensis]PYC87524.1 serine/threonine protein kinase [Streptomyces tateyamensis]